MKDELHIFCKLEGMDERYLRVQIIENNRLLRLKTKHSKNRERTGRECKSIEYSEEPSEG